MLEISNVEIAGFEPAMRGMRNPKNSWDRSDSEWLGEFGAGEEPFYELGPNDLTLAKTLADGGPVHAKYRRMIMVWLDVNAPLYWWKEFDTYKVGTVANSCSTMHKIHAKEFTPEDFSLEHLLTLDDMAMLGVPVIDCARNITPAGMMYQTIRMLNVARESYLGYCDRPTRNIEEHEKRRKQLWWQMIQLLPSCYNQKRTVMLSYEVLANIYQWRRNHKLDEWHTFCDWIESLPFSELITGKR